MFFPEREQRDKMRNAVLNLFPKDKEVWVFHPKCEIIVVSNYGQIKNLVTGHTYTQLVNRQGYHMVNINFKDKRGRRCYMVQRAVCETFFGYYDDVERFLEANHISGNKSDNSIYNLEWLTRQENLQHARENKLFKRNTAELGYCKYTEKDIDNIKKLRENGLSYTSIAKMYNGCNAYIAALVKNKTRRQKKCQV